MNQILVMVLMMLTTLTLGGQEKLFSVSDRQKEMRKLTWMVGQWEGSGWIDRGKEGRCAISYSQTVRSKQNSLMMVLDGDAKRTDNGADECSVLRLLSYPSGDEYIRWQDFSSEKGAKRMNEARASDRTLQVGFPPLKEELTRVGAGTFRDNLQIFIEGWVRITISLNERNEWTETWDMRRRPDDGDEWLRFFEVILKRSSG